MELRRISTTAQNAVVGYRQNSPQHIQQSTPTESRRFDPAVNNEKEETVLNAEERKFFGQLYPESIQEVRSYHTYRRDGTRSTFTTGTLIDRRG